MTIDEARKVLERNDNFSNPLDWPNIDELANALRAALVEVDRLNKYALGARCQNCEALVAAGFMSRREGGELNGEES